MSMLFCKVLDNLVAIYLFFLNLIYLKVVNNRFIR